MNFNKNVLHWWNVNTQGQDELDGNAVTPYQNIFVSEKTTHFSLKNNANIITLQKKLITIIII